jgi:hypothetical protein
MNKCFVLFGVLFCATFVSAQEPTLAINDGAQSVLKKEESQVVQPAPIQSSTVAVATAPSAVVVTSAVLVENATCTNCDNVVYKHKGNIAPNAVNKTVVICFCESSCEDCKIVKAKKEVPIDICVPPCPCKETVSSHRGGRRVVYDFGKYEVVIHAQRSGDIEVDYRKRLLDR